MKGVSVIVPVYNEEENVADCYKELSSVMQAHTPDYELVFVDDGSTDGTITQLLAASRDDPCLKIIEFRRNFGQTAAMAAGLEYANYDFVVTMDGDLQNDPAEIPKLIGKLKEGYDLVAGWRAERQDNYWSRRFPSKIANYIISKSTNVQLHDYGCSLKAMTKEVAKGIKLYGEMHRFIPALAAEYGARICEVPVNHRPRTKGTSKYGISRTLRVILDLMTVKFLLGYAKRPIHLFGTGGLLSIALGGLILFKLFIERMYFDIPMGNRPMLSLGVMLLILGTQFLVFGLLAELLARTYYESQDKRVYNIRTVHVHDPTKSPGAEEKHSIDVLLGRKRAGFSG